MVLGSRSLRLAASLVGMLAAVTAAPAQTRWTIDPKESLAWWQVSPHLNHLWATTCPQEPSWRPGEGRSSGWYINPDLKLPRTGYSNVQDTVHVPLFPRGQVTPVCVQAVHGEVVLSDTVHWRGAVGAVSIQGDALVTGEQMRDVAMHNVMQTAQFPEVQFTLDSLVGMTKQGDTLRGSAVGTLTVRGVSKPTTAVMKVYPVGGALRVLVKWHIPAPELHELTPAINLFGLGVNTKIWKDFFMGADLVFRPEATGAN